MSETRTEFTPSSDPNKPSGGANGEEPLLPPRVREVLDRGRSVWRRLPVMLRVFAISALATVVVVAGYFTVAPMVRENAVLFAQLESEDAAAIVEKLKAQQVPYELTGDGTTVKVPKELVHELRLTLAAEGLPRGGTVGFESFQNLRLGATEFEQQVAYRRAMEGELARTIGTIRSVQHARVHLVLRKPSVFSQKVEPASASVVVRLKGGTLERGEVMSIVHLVASAVADLDPSSVAVVTTDGQMLHRPRSGALTDDEENAKKELDQLALARQHEELLEQRARTMLERVTGEGHVDVSVSADLDVSKIETTADTFNHAKSSLRSEQQTVERTSAGDVTGADTVAGVPGVASPQAAESADTVGEAPAVGNVEGTFKRQHSRNFEIDRVQERRTHVAQSVKRLTVAVVVDGLEKDGVVVARSEAELEKFGQLVRSAVGFNEERGDVVTVESVPFFPEQSAEVAEVPLLPIPAPIREKYGKYFPLAQVLGVGIPVALVMLLVTRRVRRTRRESIERAQLALKASAEEAAKAAELKRRDDTMVRERIGHREEALRRASEDPATAALVLRQWLTEPVAALPAPGDAAAKGQPAKKAA